MITLFRKMRQNNFSENRFTRYVLYALGEIVLVVFGILIALQVNNWNNQNSRNQKEEALLREMRVNLAADLKDCQWNINRQKGAKNASQAVLDHLSSGDPFHDSLASHYGLLMGSTALTTNTSAFDNLKSIGFDLIQNDSLRKSITGLYSERYTYLVRIENDADNKFSMEQLIPQISEKLIMDTLWVSARPLNLESLRKDTSFKGMVRMNISFRDFMIRTYEGIERRIISLIEQIDRELESR
jgi:hypothetical protein